MCRCERNLRIPVAEAELHLDHRTEINKSIQVRKTSTTIKSRKLESQPSTNQDSYAHSLVTNT